MMTGDGNGSGDGDGDIDRNRGRNKKMMGRSEEVARKKTRKFYSPLKMI